ncbi:MAG: chemotaxis-specific protein-glutamate methyltransferase CheB [Oscillospiraceae bacterium]|nr:chemotaxis-specific protein-glutamate methyltransferase CheB [Oscillospiraceae bacterium]
MDRIKLLVVDDSILFREVLSRYILQDDMIQIVGKVGDAYSARDMILKYEPHVMTLDLEMPRMDGVAFLKNLLPQYYIPTIVVSSSEARKNDCKSAGAVEFLSKPAARTNADMEKFAAQLCGAVRRAYKSNHPNSSIDVTKTPFGKAQSAGVSPMTSAVRSGTSNIAETAAMAEKIVNERRSSLSSTTSGMRPSSMTEAADAAPASAVPASRRGKFKRSDTIIALGASTGGTEALEQVIKHFPKDTPPVIIVQHMPAGFTKLYAERLNRSCMMEVKEAADGDRLRSGLIVIGAGENHLRLCKDARGWYVSSKPGEKVSGHCPSVDVMFNSVAEVAGPQAIGAILTGMGRDGADGLLKMRQRGAFTIGQDKETCVVYGMPMEAYKIGAVEVQAPLYKIADIILNSLT